MIFICVSVTVNISGNVSLYPGETATFTCEVNTKGINDVSFQWVRTNGTTVIFFNKSLDFREEASGAGSGLNQIYYYNSTFNATNVNYTDDNTGYYCNASGCNASMTAYLTGKLYCVMISVIRSI